MSFLVIIICLCVQWFLHFGSAPYQRQSVWMMHYVNAMREPFSKLLQGHDIFGLIIYVLPILIVTSLIFTITYHLFGHVGYSLLSLILLWYCVDVTVLQKSSGDFNQLLLNSYQHLFAPLFWYFVFGPVGLTLYIVVQVLHAQFGEKHYFTVAQGVLDWVPLRLVGLSFALVSNFVGVFKEWVTILPKGILDNQTVLNYFSKAALSNNADQADSMSLIHRALIAWLVVMALVTVGIWIG